MWQVWILHDRANKTIFSLPRLLGFGFANPFFDQARECPSTAQANYTPFTYLETCFGPVLHVVKVPKMLGVNHGTDRAFVQFSSHLPMHVAVGDYRIVLLQAEADDTDDTLLDIVLVWLFFMLYLGSSTDRIKYEFK